MKIRDPSGKSIDIADIEREEQDLTKRYIRDQFGNLLILLILKKQSKL